MAKLGLLIVAIAFQLSVCFIGYSSAQVQLVKGIHWDIEPHGLPNWETDQQTIIPQFLNLLDKIKGIMAGSGLLNTLDIPMWLDTITTTRNGQTKLLSEIVIDTVDRVAIMDYRDWAYTRPALPTDNNKQGATDGMVYHAQSEIIYASQRGKKVVVLAELDCFDPGYITYCQEDTGYMEGELAKVRDAFKGYSSFDGLGIHHTRAWAGKTPAYTLPNTCNNKKDVFGWWNDIVTDPTAKANFFSFCQTHAVRTLYLESERLIQPSNQAALITFLREAYANKISVELLFGAAEWVLTENHEIPLNLARLAVAFQKSLTNAVPAYNDCGSGVVTTGPVTTGPATTGPATTGPSTTTGSPSGGGSGTVPREMIVLTRVSEVSAARSSFTVTIGYSAQARRDIVVELLDAANNNGFGKGLTTVNAGKDSVSITVTITQALGQGINFYIRAWSVDAGMGNIPGAYNSAYDQDRKNVNVTPLYKVDFK